MIILIIVVAIIGIIAYYTYAESCRNKVLEVQRQAKKKEIEKEKYKRELREKLKDQIFTEDGDFLGNKRTEFKCTEQLFYDN